MAKSCYYRRGIWLRLARTVSATIGRSAYAQRFFSSPHLVEQMGQWTLAERALFQRVFEWSYATRGTASIATLAAHCSLSLRHCERQFRQGVGVPPKFFARLIRFEAVRDSILEDPYTHQSKGAWDFGYHDQAHLSREFKLWAGYTPTIFKQMVVQRSQSGCLLMPDPRPALPIYLL